MSIFQSSIIIGIIIPTTIVGLYKAYYYGKYKLQEYVLEKVMEELNNRMKNEEEKESFKPIHTNSAVVKINTGGKDHSVYLPYNRKRSIPMLKSKVYLMKGEEKIEISQKPGIPYLICAADMGGESIIVENLDSEIIHTFSCNEIPDCF